MSFVVDGPNPRGRPRLRWSDVVQKDMKIKDINITLADDREKWRNAIKPQTTQQMRLQPATSGRRSINDQ